MSRNSINLLQAIVLFAAIFMFAVNGFAQSDAKKEEIVADAKVAKAEFIKDDPKMANLFSKAYGCDFPERR